MTPTASSPIARGIAPADREDRARNVIYLLGDTEQIGGQLGHFGYRVTTFRGAKQTVEAAADQLPSLLIASVDAATGVDGPLEAVAHFAQRGVPTVVLSASSDFETHLKAVNAGANAYFVRPVPCHELLDAVEYLTDTSPPTPYRVLIVEDVPARSRRYARMLATAHMESAPAGGPGDILDQIEAFDPDLLLVDAGLELRSAQQLTQLLRRLPAHLAIPVLFLSGEGGLDPQIAAMAPGAEDLPAYRIEPGPLAAAATAKAERYRSLRAARDRDPMTGLPDHCRLRKHLDMEVARASRNRRPLCVAVIDLDNFTEVNACHGQGGGDKMLKGLGRLLSRWLREDDLVGRYGADEFAVILPDTRPEAAQQLLEEARGHFAQVVFDERGRRYSGNFSAGLAIHALGMKGADLLARSERALHRAKRGRERIVLG